MNENEKGKCRIETEKWIQTIWLEFLLGEIDDKKKEKKNHEENETILTVCLNTIA